MPILLLTLKIKIDHISTSTRLMATTHGILVSSDEGSQPAKLLDPGITGPNEVTEATDP